LQPDWGGALVTLPVWQKPYLAGFQSGTAGAGYAK